MEHGTLYIIATPIGNLEDITFRAVRILKEVADMAYCEDTRQSKKLLSSYEIQIPLRSLHAHSSDERIDEVCSHLEDGKNIAYLTDAGTPSVSDPGSRLVARVQNKGLTVVPLPGASALTTLISIAGFAEKQVLFAGFISKKPGKRINELTKLKETSGIIVLYESPYRIKKLLTAIAEVFPGSNVVIGRELTKKHEDIIAASIEEIMENLDSLTEKGEFAVAIHNT
jgi:16S rRNA (cytidine1402-2'-O)-methyltransferase